MIFHSHLLRPSESLREKRLLSRNVEVLPEQVLETFLQTNQDVAQLERAVGTLDESSLVYQAMLERSKSLTEQQRSVIDSNCQRLQEQSKAKVETLRKISLLQNGINTSRLVPGAPATTEPNALERTWAWTKEKTHAGWERTKEFAQEHPTLTIAVGSTIGVALVYKLWKWWRGDKKTEEKGEKKEEKSAEKESTFWKVLKWIPGVGLMALAGWGIYEGVQWMKKNLGSLDQMKTLLANAENRLKSMVGLGNKGAKYGLQEDEYHDAADLWKRYGESGTDQISKVFGDNMEGRDKFLEDMRQKTDVLPHNGIGYQRIETALSNYELGLESAAKAVETWMENHKMEVLVGSVLAVRFGILRAILRGSSSVTMKALALGNTMRRWAQHHPLASLFMLGGAAAGTFAACRALKNAHLPKNLSELAKACAEKKELIVGDTAEIAKEQQEFLYDCGSRLADFTGDIATYVEKQFGDLASLMIDSLSGAIDSIALKRQEAIAEKQEDCTMILRLHLSAKLQDVQTDQEKKNAGAVQRYEEAIRLLEQYSDAQIRAHCTDNSTPGESEAFFSKFQQTFASLDTPISLTRSNGVVQWKTKEMEAPLDLAVDPSIHDHEQAYALSNKLWHGESAGSRIGGAMLQEWRESQQRNLDKIGHGHPFAAVLVGNMLHCIDPDNIERYFSVPIDLVEGMLFESDEDRKRKGFQVTLGNAAATTIMFTLSAEVIANIKRFAVGGGAMRFRGLRTVVRFIPGVSQVEMLTRIWGLKDEARVFSVLRSKMGWMNARRVLRVLGKANILPRQIALLKYTQDPDELIRLARAWNLGGHPKTIISEVINARASGNTVALQTAMEKLRTALREHVIDMRLKFTKIWDPLKSGKIFGRSAISSEAKAIFDDVADALAPSVVPQTSPLLTPPAAANVAGGTPPQPSAQPKPSPKPSPKPKVGGDGASAAEATSPRRPGMPAAEGPAVQPAKAGTTGVAEAEGTGRMNPRSRGVVPESSPSTSGIPTTHEPISEEGARRFEQEAGTFEDQLARRGTAAAGAETAAAAAEIPAVSAGARHVESILKDERVVKALAGTKDAVEAEKALRAELAALDPKTLNMIAESGRAKKLLSGAVASGKAPEIARITTAARRAATLKVTWNGVGALGDVYGIYMAWCDYDQNKERILQTDNPDLKQLYSRANYLYAAEGASSAAGLLLGGIAIYQSVAAGNTLIVALGAPAGMVMLPIAALAFGARVTYQKCEESSEYHLLNSRDMQKKYTPGQILEHIGKSARLSNVNWAQDFFINAETVRRANENARWEGYDAYFAQIAAEHIRPASVMDIDADSIPPGTSADPKAMQAFLENAINVQQRERISTFVRSAGRYVAYKTQGSYEIVTPEVLRNAALYAEIQFDQWERTGSADARAKEDASYWEEMELKVVGRAGESARLIMADVSKFSGDPAMFEREAPGKLLYLLRDELGDCERRLLTTDFSNWWNGANWIPFKNWYSDRDLQMVARGVIAEQIFDSLQKAVDGVRQKKSFSEADARQLHAQLRTVITQDFDTLAIGNMSKANIGTLRYVGEQTSRMGMVNVLRLFGTSLQSAQPAEKEQGPDSGLHQKVLAGTSLMDRIGANHDGSYYTKQFGWTGNKFLYMRFDEGQGKWLAGLWNLEQLKDPATFCCTMWGGSAKYNQLLEDLDAINQGKEPSQ